MGKAKGYNEREEDTKTWKGWDNINEKFEFLVQLFNTQRDSYKISSQQQQDDNNVDGKEKDLFIHTLFDNKLFIPIYWTSLYTKFKF